MLAICCLLILIVFFSFVQVKDAVQHCLDLIISSYNHTGTKNYDSFQYYTNGILP